MSKSLKALLGGFTPTELPQDMNSLIPEGEYSAIIDKVEVKTSKEVTRFFPQHQD